MKRKSKNLAAVGALCSFFFILGLNSGCKGQKEKEAEEMAPPAKAPDIKERLAQYAPTEITFDESLLNEEQKRVLKKLILAARHMDDIFWKQASHKGLAVKKRLEESGDPADRDYLQYLKINFSPYDRLDENRPFIGSEPKPPGAGFYPADLTKQEFQEFIARHPEAKEELESHYTVIRRENSGLKAVPYNQAYREDLEPASKLLREAAGLTTNPSLKKYLLQRAEDLLSNHYYQSDCDWIDLHDNLVEIVIGPYEVYEDNLMGLKAAYESFVYINDRDEMKKIKGYLDYLEEMQKNLPVEKKYKDQEVGGLKSPLNVVMEVFTAGDTKAGVQTSAFVLPNDERVREEKGTKKVFLKNVMEAKFNKSLIPISQRVLWAQDAESVSFYAYFAETILHEIAHALGVNYTTLPDGTKTTVNKALKEHYSPLEEAKATIVGLYQVPFLIEEGWIPPEKEKEIYTTYLAGIFRSLRFGVHEAHGLATLMEFNFLRENGAFLYDEDSEKFNVDTGKIKEGIKNLAQKLLLLQGDGDYEKAAEFISRYGQMDEITENMINRLDHIPVDIEPQFTYLDKLEWTGVPAPVEE
ncbi:MAG: dipeptidyl-peptidase 3 family protein [Candidatus Aminicenantes bacterium]